MSENRNSKRLEHAHHNEEVCFYLSERSHWDWVVTAAFYAANHYVRYKLFPLTEEADGNEVTFQVLDDYSTAINNRPRRGRRPSRHRIVSDLVRRELGDDIAEMYDWLKQTSYTTRYNDYEVSETLASTAIDYMTQIKEFCEAEDLVEVAVPIQEQTGEES